MDATDLVTAADALPIPARLKKGFWSAVGRLATGIVDIPAAKLESYADEIRAATDARRQLMNSAASAIAADFKGAPDVAVRAQARLSGKILREQVNVEDILRIAAEDLTKAQLKEEPAPVDPDWMNNFEAEGVQKSSEEMKLLFGRILSGEIQRPGTFSIKTVKTISQLDKRTAEKFAAFCSLSINFQIDGRVLSLGRNAAQNGLADFGFPFAELNNLESHGLIISDYNSYLPIRQFAKINAPIDYAGKAYLLRSPPEIGELNAHGVALTRVGRELRAIVDVSENSKYSEKLIAFLRTNQIELAPLN